MRWLRICVLGVIAGGLLLTANMGKVSSAAMQQEDPGCTYMIRSNVDKVDGLKNFAQVKPGDTLCFTAGTRGNIRVLNLHGTAEQPITIRNSGGVVAIIGMNIRSGGIGVNASSYLRITGSGVKSKCGAEFIPENQECGIEIRDTTKGILINTSENNVHHLEIDHVLINKTSTVSSSVGIAIHPKEQQMVTGISIHHNYVSETQNEGIYIGTEPAGRPLEMLGKVEDVEVSYNLVEQTGFDGIKIKVATNNVRVHHNIIRWPARSRTEHHQGGITIVLSVGDYYNNFIVTDQQGIYMGRILDSPGTRYFNNVVVGAEMVGIRAPEKNPQIFNNTVVKSGVVGILAEGEEAMVYNNIVVDTIETPIQIKNGSECNNFVGSLDTAGFLDPVNYNFRLNLTSPVVNTGCDDLPIPPEDIRGVSRPQDGRVDPGAYEHFLIIPIPRTYDSSARRE